MFFSSFSWTTLNACVRWRRRGRERWPAAALAGLAARTKCAATLLGEAARGAPRRTRARAQPTRLAPRRQQREGRNQHAGLLRRAVNVHLLNRRQAARGKGRARGRRRRNGGGARGEGRRRAQRAGTHVKPVNSDAFSLAMSLSVPSTLFSKLVRGSPPLCTTISPAASVCGAGAGQRGASKRGGARRATSKTRRTTLHAMQQAACFGDAVQIGAPGTRARGAALTEAIVARVSACAAVCVGRECGGAHRFLRRVSSRAGWSRVGFFRFARACARVLHLRCPRSAPPSRRSICGRYRSPLQLPLLCRRRASSPP